MNAALLEEPRSASRSVLRAESLAHSVMFMLALVVAQRLIGFVRGVLFCRWLDPAVLGQWEMAFAFLTMAAPLAVLGVPGSFGRYIEHYRQAGQLTLFLRRTAVFTGFVVAVALLLLNLRPDLVSYIVFDRYDELALVGVLTASLGAVICFNYITDVFTGLRMVRVVSLLQVVQGVSFAAIGIALVALWQASASLPPLAWHRWRRSWRARSRCIAPGKICRPRPSPWPAAQSGGSCCRSRRPCGGPTPFPTCSRWPIVMSCCTTAVFRPTTP
jgi:hypothetical protein